MYWSNFLHIYQPPTQTEEMVRKVTDEGYRRLVHVLKEAPQGRSDQADRSQYRSQSALLW